MDIEFVVPDDEEEHRQNGKKACLRFLSDALLLNINQSFPYAIVLHLTLYILFAQAIYT